jgi:hypothetical protein
MHPAILPNKKKKKKRNQLLQETCPNTAMLCFSVLTISQAGFWFTVAVQKRTCSRDLHVTTPINWSSWRIPLDDHRLKISVK